MNDLAWIDDTSHDELLELLRRHGVELSGDPADAPPAPKAAPGEQFQLVPLGTEWLRIGMDPEGRLCGHWIVDPTRPLVTDERPAILFEEEAPDLHGWFRARADIDGSGTRWLAVLRRPEREAYAAVLYDAGPEGPVRRMIVAGIYPDITLCDDGRRIAYVEPDQDCRGGQFAYLAEAHTEKFENSRTQLAYSPTGGLAVRACSVRRFFKLSHGVRSTRLWDLVDARADTPTPITVPGVPNDPALFDVALLDDEIVLVQGLNHEDNSWTLRASLIEDGEILDFWDCARVRGHARQVTSGDGCALVRATEEGDEAVYRIPIEGFSTVRTALHTTQGLLDLSGNSVTPSIGFAAVELVGGIPPFSWYWDVEGVVLNSADERAARAASIVSRTRLKVASADGYEFVVDVRWSGDHGDRFSGPVVLMLYGAYKLDIDLDTDPDLGTWLSRGFAVATAHVRGGGDDERHLAGCRANRPNSLADAAAAIRHLRSGAGAVRATQVVTLGASAGGFLTATTVNTCPDEVDVAVIVNGFVDPLTSLLRQDTATRASDEDEWGNPDNPNDLAALHEISPVENIKRPGPTALVIVSGQDVRVNPRQGLKWFLKYRDAGGEADLWFDPQGAHDCWGAGMPRGALIDWVVDALERRRRLAAA